MLFSKFGKVLSLFLTAVFLFPQISLAAQLAPIPITVSGNDTSSSEFQITIGGDEAKLAEIQKSLQAGPTHFEYTKYMMLKHKIDQAKESAGNSYNSYGLKPRGVSPLSREYSGIPLNTGGVSYNYLNDSRTIDLITGASAIDESLQLGSIRSRTTAEEARLRTDQNRLRTLLELEYNNNGFEYPDSLTDLENLGQIDIEKFEYQKSSDGKSYTLGIVIVVQDLVPIEAVEGLTIEHHPWEEMIGTRRAEVPDIYRLIPEDFFFIHFNNLNRYRELEETISQMAGPLAQVYGVGESISTQKRIFDRLGIVDNPNLDTFFDEVAFVSYDFDGYPATDYALILKTKSAMFDKLISNHIDSNTAAQDSVGEYYVIATSEKLLDHIRKTNEGTVDAMSDALDLQYSLVTLEKDRDGFAFISDSFVEKVTSPAYRINAGRRNAVLQALETLQYSVFAYKDLTGDWPEDVEEMMTSGYLRADSVFEIEKYSIQGNGVVRHQDWGSIYDVTPIMRVDIDTVRPIEVTSYDNFREGYQQFWQEFIDPVAINILIGDQIKFHTIILPLIESSEYNWIRDVVGDETGPLDFVVDPDRIPAVQLASHFDIDSVLHAVYRSSPRSFDIGYQECQKNYYADRQSYTRSGTSLREACPLDELLEEDEAINAVKSSISDLIGWEGSEVELFSFMGDEMALAASENVQFMIDDLTNFDVYLGMELVDPAEAQLFLEHVFKWVAEELFGFGGRSAGVGMFGVQPGQPIKNSYNGTEYYVLPTGWINLFYVYLDDRVYFTLSQNTINALIEGEEGSEWSGNMSRLLDYLDPNSDVSLLLDGERFDLWLDSFVKEQMSSYLVSIDFDRMKTYFKEVNQIESMLEEEVETYYSYIPDEWFNLSLVREGQDTYVLTDAGRISLQNVRSSRYYYSYNRGNEPEIEFDEFMENVDIERIISEWAGIDTFGVTLKMTEEGLDIEVAFNNAARDEYDERVPVSYLSTKSETEYSILISILIVIALVAAMFIFGYMAVHKGRDERLVENNDQTGVPNPLPTQSGSNVVQDSIVENKEQ